ncbi:putative catechol -dioxygenase 1 [Rosellinia necatrix]|uniref:Putative catechol-dioxygenase 1 n=1 Tax=Rosellinia necatrix TaxID=77044 RepID=A0A1S8A8X6_ROSNE|nr:putative catechol -dioxygenase 1 [Rosellinia necatrix]
MSTDKRNETQLICDILGLESLVDEISSKILSRSSSSSSSGGGGGGGGGSTAAAGVAAAATPSTVLGPFHRADAPMLANGSSIISPAARGTAWYGSAEPRLARLTGRVLSASTGRALAGAAVEVWLAGPNGLYEQQDPGQPDMNLRGRFRTDGAGRYDVYALRPAAYPIPLDGPAGRLLALLDRPPYRPAHVHFIVAAAGHATLVTQLFDREDGHARRDAVFAVKEELLVSFEERAGDNRARWQLTYDFLLREV